MFRENHDVFFKDFGETVTVAPRTDGAAEITAIFDNIYFEHVLGETGMEGTQPRIICKTLDVKKVKQGTLITIREKDYTVTRVMPDGTGITEFYLQE